MGKTKLVLAVVLGLAVGACAHTEAAPTDAPKSVERSRVLTAKATVVDVNQVTRLVTLKHEDGTTLSFRASLDVKNLDQVAAGDVVTVQYFEELVMLVFEPHEASINQADAQAATAEKGQLPAGVAAQQVTVTIRSTDKAAGTVTFSLPNGDIKTVRAADPKNLDLIKENDRVAVTYVEAMGISLQKARAGAPRSTPVRKRAAREAAKR